MLYVLGYFGQLLSKSIIFLPPNLSNYSIFYTTKKYLPEITCLFIMGCFVNLFLIFFKAKLSVLPFLSVTRSTL